MSPPSNQHNVILFGESGCGKSSLVNMIVGRDVATVSSEPLGCTFENNSYDATIGSTNFCIYDTAGLNEGDQGRVPHWKAVRELYTLIRRLDGVSLLIYCVRGRIKENSWANWILFNKVICGEQVPVVLVVTGLENEVDWEDPSRIGRIKNAYKSYNIKPAETTTVVAIKGKKDEYAEHYQISRTKLRNIIADCHRMNPWSTAKDKWFANIYHTTYTSGVCFSVRTKVEFNDQMRVVIDEFVKETSMTEDESNQLQATLRTAEKKVLDSKKKGNGR